MQTRTIERTETDERVDDGTDSDTPKYFHYVKKDKIAESAVMGSHVVALCGEVFPVTRAAKPARRYARSASGSTSGSRRTDQAGGSAVATSGCGVAGFVGESTVRLRADMRDSTQVRSRWACVFGAGNSSWMAALSSAPIMMAKPPKNANNRNAIGVD